MGAATEVGQIRREPPATSGVYPEMLASGCVVSDSVCGEDLVSLKSAGPDEASRRLVPTPEVGGGLSYIWGSRGVRIASPCSPQLNTSATALPRPSAFWHGPMRRLALKSEVICSLGPGRVLVSRTNSE
jgi:hypothetical protein